MLVGYLRVSCADARGRSAGPGRAFGWRSRSVAYPSRRPPSLSLLPAAAGSHADPLRAASALPRALAQIEPPCVRTAAHWRDLVEATKLRITRVALAAAHLDGNPGNLQFACERMDAPLLSEPERSAAE